MSIGILNSPQIMHFYHFKVNINRPFRCKHILICCPVNLQNQTSPTTPTQTRTHIYIHTNTCHVPSLIFRTIEQYERNKKQILSLFSREVISNIP